MNLNQGSSQFQAQQNPGPRNSNLTDTEKDIGAEFGTKLSINPNLPVNTDYTNGEALDTPNSFKFGSGNTPTTPFGLTHLQFPQGITFANFGNIAMQPTPQMSDATNEDLLNFMPKTPLQVHQGTTASRIQQGQGFAGIHANQMGIGQSQPSPIPITRPHSQSLGPTSSLNINPMSNLATQSELKVKNDASKTKKKGARLKRGRSSSAGAGKDESRWKSWTREEEVFLVGAVMDRFFKRGSLSSTRADDLTSDDSWSVIKNYYETAWKNYYLKTGVRIPTERPANALSRHYKVMKARISASDISGEESENFRTFFDEWESMYNVNNCLVAELNTSNGRAKALAMRKNGPVRDFTKRKVRLSVRQAPSNFL